MIANLRTDMNQLRVVIDDEELLARVRIIADALGGDVLDLRVVVLALLSEKAAELESTVEQMSSPAT